MKHTIPLFALVVSACGDGGDDGHIVPPDIQTTTLPTSPAADAVPKTGYLLNIKGVRYNACGYQGTTGDRGAFTYDSKPYQCVTAFYLGNMQLGQRINAADIPVPTPYNLFPGDAVAGANLLTFFQSVNARPNTQGVIEIPSSVDLAARDAGWSSSTIDFKTNFTATASQALASLGAKLIESSIATASYAPYVNCLHTGHFLGNFNGYADSEQKTDPNTGEKTTTYSGTFDGRVEGIQSPDGQMWMNLLQKPDSGSGQYYLPYEVLTGTVPIAQTLHTGEYNLSFDYDGPYGYKGRLTSAVHPTYTGYIEASSVNRRINPWNSAAGADWSRFYYDIPEMRFAGRAGTTVLGMDVYADGVVRTVVADTEADTEYEVKGLGRSLLKATMDANGHVVGSGTVDEFPQEEQTYTIDFTIDRSSMTAVGKASFTSLTAEGAIELTVDNPAKGCFQFAVVE